MFGGLKPKLNYWRDNTLQKGIGGYCLRSTMSNEFFQCILYKMFEPTLKKIIHQ